MDQDNTVSAVAKLPLIHHRYMKRTVASHINKFSRMNYGDSNSSLVRVSSLNDLQNNTKKIKESSRISNITNNSLKPKFCIHSKGSYYHPRQLSYEYICDNFETSETMKQRTNYSTSLPNGKKPFYPTSNLCLRPKYEDIFGDESYLYPYMTPSDDLFIFEEQLRKFAKETELINSMNNSLIDVEDENNHLDIEESRETLINHIEHDKQLNNMETCEIDEVMVIKRKKIDKMKLNSLSKWSHEILSKLSDDWNILPCFIEIIDTSEIILKFIHSNHQLQSPKVKTAFLRYMNFMVLHGTAFQYGLSKTRNKWNTIETVGNQTENSMKIGFIESYESFHEFLIFSLSPQWIKLT